VPNSDSAPHSREAVQAPREELEAQIRVLRETNARLEQKLAARESLIAGREEVEHKLRESEETFRKLFDENLDSMTIIDLMRGNFLDVNKEFERNSGYRREEIVGKRFWKLSFFCDGNDLNRFATELRENRLVRNLEATLRRKDGTTYPGLVSAIVLPLHGTLCCVTFTRNIADLKETQCQLIEAREAALAASRAKSEFLSSMSHEIRTPMNAVLGMAELLQESELADEQRRYLEVMIANGNALLDLINSILDLAKIETGRLQIENTDFDLTDLIEKTISTFGVRAHGKGLELAARIEPGVPDRLIGDPLRLRQILINLLGNAVKFTEIGQIVLTVANNPESNCLGDLIFKVADTGIGIAPDKLGQIFSNFTQADSSTTRKYGGSGLGLAIVKRLTEVMGGLITVRSELGKGSTFSFSARFGLAPRVLSPTRQFVPSLAGYQVLIVDDNQVNRLIAREMIASCGAEIEEAASAEEALDAVSRAGARPFQIILLDMRMPEMDGLEVARRIREANLPTEPLVLMLSSDDLKPQVARLKEIGLDAYLVKPITRKELFGAINRVLLETGRCRSDGIAERHTAKALRGKGNRPMRILLAEDSPDNRLVFQAYLHREAHQIDFAQNGQIAVDKFITHPYDLVFMDMQMPELDGFEATRIIREWENGQGLRPVPIIALSASALDEDVKRSLAAGCSAHIAKPVKKQTILNAIAATTRRASDERQSAVEATAFSD
jgi:two-component system, sensor histidine kinase and response regulator